MAKRQIDDEGAVIGYQPKLYYDKSKTLESEGTQGESSGSPVSQLSAVERHSKCFASFCENTPSKALSTLDFAISNMKKLVDKLSKSFHKGNWNQYNEISSLLSAVENNNKDYITQFVDFHRNNITGDIAPELIEIVYNTKCRLELLQSTLKQLYYGNESISKEECEEIDKAYIEKIRTYENSDQLCKINYIALSSDSILNRSVSTYALNANKGCIKIADIVNKTDNSVTNSSMIPTVEKMFGELTTEIDSRNQVYELQQNVEILEKTLYNYYNKRQDLMNLYDLLGDSESTYLIRKMKVYQGNLDNALKNVNKTFIGNQMYLSELEKMESEKHFLLNIYAELSNNS